MSLQENLAPEDEGFEPDTSMPVAGGSRGTATKPILGMHGVPSFVKPGTIKYTHSLYTAQMGTEVKCTQQASENGYLLMTGSLYLVFYPFSVMCGVTWTIWWGVLPLEIMWFESDPGGKGCFHTEHSGPFHSLSRDRQD